MDWRNIKNLDLSTNHLLYGDNLLWLPAIPDGSVDMVYLDPPFKSDRVYNAIYGSGDDPLLNAQIQAFDDTWRWNSKVEERFKADLDSGVFPEDLEDQMRVWYRRLVVMKAQVGKKDQMARESLMAYLAAMAPRLVEMKRILRPGGAIYLHCDDSADAYLRQLMDSLFTDSGFRNELIWKRTSAHSNSKRFGRIHDVIFYYLKPGGTSTWNPQYTPYDPEYIASHYHHNDADGKGLYQRDQLTAPGASDGDSGEPWRGIAVRDKNRGWIAPEDASELLGLPSDMPTRQKLDALDAAGFIYWPPKDGGMPRYKRYLNTQKGVPAQDMILDIPPINAQATERMGYPTQKPRALLDRLILSSTNPGDLIVDPFAGCFTAIESAESLGRRWIGMDITYQGIALAIQRLSKIAGCRGYKVLGSPTELNAARALAEESKRQFQEWIVLGLLARYRAIPSPSLGADGGIDGVIPLRPLLGSIDQDRDRCIVSVKGGKPKALDVDEIIGSVTRHKAQMGLLVSLGKPTSEMVKRADAAGRYIAGDGQAYPKIQIATVESLMNKSSEDDPLFPGVIV